MYDRQLRKLQKTRHLADIKRMILSNPVFKNLGDRDQKTLAKLVYKAEWIELYARERDILRVNDSFDEIIDAINQAFDSEHPDDDDDFDRNGRNDKN